MKLLARIKDGQLELWGKPDLTKFEGKEVDVIIQHKTRRLEANAYYWAAIVSVIADEIGETPEDTHELLKQRILPRKFITVKSKKTGQKVEIETRKSTRKMKIDEFADYVEKCKIWASIHLNIIINDN